MKEKATVLSYGCTKKSVDETKVRQHSIARTRCARLLPAGLDDTAHETSAAGSNETSLLTSGRLARDGRGVTNVLVVTTTVRVVDGVHGNTTSTGPRVALDAELVVGTTSLEHGLVDTATTSDDADGSAGRRGDRLLCARGETDASDTDIGVVADDGGVVAGGTGEGSTVTSLLLDVADNGTLGERGEGEDVADVESGLLAAVDELAGVHALGGNERLGAQLVAVRVTEGDASKGSTAAEERGGRLGSAAANGMLMRCTPRPLTDQRRG